ncbi:hypothetical protein VFPBJ_07893 [Purpureocillium lilacinum]|uniref:Uncharacterized protein n=1 Tax=Purpureocillium lilacinum TaxID=33203 RepID=A0A179GJ75_PURLI|nr:hypothetical protein VFPBJ_07893 [Purpureocillium lilacinum]
MADEDNGGGIPQPQSNDGFMECISKRGNEHVHVTGIAPCAHEESTLSASPIGLYAPPASRLKSRVMRCVTMREGGHHGIKNIPSACRPGSGHASAFCQPWWPTTRRNI